MNNETIADCWSRKEVREIGKTDIIMNKDKDRLWKRMHDKNNVFKGTYDG